MIALAKVLCLGIDAAEKDLILGWAGSGALPTFAGLFTRAAWAPIANPVGVFEGAVWPSLFTGASPARHGRYCYRQLRPGTYELARFPARRLEAEPIWNRLSRAGRRVAVIDVPKSAVAEDLNGMQVVDWGTHDPEPDGFRTVPVSLAGEVTARFGHDPVGICDRYPSNEGLAVLRDRLLARVERRGQLIGHYLERGGWDLFLSVFSESHCAGHQFWHLHDSTHPQHPPDAAMPGDPLKDVYVAIDAALGKILARTGPDTKVLVWTSHGMGPHYDGSSLLDAVLHALGDGPAPLPTRSVPRLLQRCWRRTPGAVREWLDPVRDRIVRAVYDAPTRLDGSANCFQVPNNDAWAGIRINVVGREPRGRIRPGRELDAFCARLSGDLLELVNVDTGEPAVRGVVRTSDVHRGPLVDHLPDLLVEWNRERPIAAVCSPRTGRVEGPYAGPRTGDHRPDGLCFLLGTPLAPGRMERSVSVEDVAPTIASLLGIRPPDIDGEALVTLSDYR